MAEAQNRATIAEACAIDYGQSTRPATPVLERA
jgi:hypothetical protein